MTEIVSRRGGSEKIVIMFVNPFSFHLVCFLPADTYVRQRRDNVELWQNVMELTCRH